MQVNQVNTDQQYDNVVEKCRGDIFKKDERLWYFMARVPHHFNCRPDIY